MNDLETNSVSSKTRVACEDLHCIFQALRATMELIQDNKLFGKILEDVPFFLALKTPKTELKTLV